ncbi:hypothetical protein [Sphingomonas radiodurans]|uniref:hypothetical protein n=1 Tax=Sphingomonas radiodurans TaxID=2890321 RepID=UPI001E474971|nr:hypothetical protein [Sphingomonas radiodurans]WBH17982.1 hypothetical protein LLW23_07790 [Sphingomonas radiodurans]
MDPQIIVPDINAGASSRTQADLLLYDYYKHMTTLILATLGGILSISQLSGIAVPIRDVLPALALISFGGITALYAMEGMISARLRQKSTPSWVRWSRQLVGGSFGLGVGAFLGRMTNLVG